MDASERHGYLLVLLALTITSFLFAGILYVELQDLPDEGRFTGLLRISIVAYLITGCLPLVFLLVSPPTFSMMPHVYLALIFTETVVMGSVRVLLHSLAFSGGVLYLSCAFFIGHMAGFFDEKKKAVLPAFVLSGIVLYGIPVVFSLQLPSPSYESLSLQAFLSTSTLVVVFYGVFWKEHLKVSGKNEQLTERIARDEHFAALGRNTTAVTHNVKNTLSAVRSGLMLIDTIVNEQEVPKPVKRETARTVSTLYKKTGESIRTMERFLNLARVGSKTAQCTINLKDVLEAIIAERRHYAPSGDHILITIECPFDCFLLSEGREIVFVFENMIDNSCQAITQTRGSGRVNIRVRNSDTEIEVSIEDNGGGFLQCGENCSGECLWCTKLAAGSSTKPTGHGFGLVFVKEWLKRRGGKFIIDNKPGLGAVVHVIIPKFSSF